jgi:hypothetical protein
MIQRLSPVSQALRCSILIMSAILYSFTAFLSRVGHTGNGKTPANSGQAYHRCTNFTRHSRMEHAVLSNSVRQSRQRASGSTMSKSQTERSYLEKGRKEKTLARLADRRTKDADYSPSGFRVRTTAKTMKMWLVCFGTHHPGFTHT